jgi:hypothetical protein
VRGLATGRGLAAGRGLWIPAPTISAAGLPSRFGGPGIAGWGSGAPRPPEPGAGAPAPGPCAPAPGPWATRPCAPGPCAPAPGPWVPAPSAPGSCVAAASPGIPPSPDPPAAPVSSTCSSTRPRRSAGAGIGGTAASRANGLASLRRAAPHTSQVSTWRATRFRINGENRPSQPVRIVASSGQSARPRRATSNAPRERSTWSRRRLRRT